MGFLSRWRSSRDLAQGQALLREGQRSKARGVLQAAVERAPADHGLRIHLALACAETGDPEAGLSVLDDGAGCFSEPAILALYRGIMLLEAGRHEEAGRALAVGQQAAPENRLIRAYQRLGQIQAGNVREGVAGLQELGIPENFSFQKRLAIYLEKQLFLKLYQPERTEGGT